MESPLDVLSRAASAIETDEKEAEGGLHRSDSFGGNPSKELPSRINRQRRSAERRDLSQVLHFDQAHHPASTCAPTTSTKCAATQTIISTVRQEGSEFVGIPTLNPAALPPPSSSSLISHIPLSPPPHLHPAYLLEMRHQRPSVINKAPSMPTKDQQDNQTNGDTEQRTNGLIHPQLERGENGGGSPTEVCDEIEEHFRRSLGKDYPEEKKSTPVETSAAPVSVVTPPTPSPQASPPVSVSGSVDDHFAKALGDKWSRIKTEMAPNNGPASPPNTPSPAALTSQVFKHTSFVSS